MLSAFQDMAAKFSLSKTLLFWYAPVSYLGAALAHSYQSELLNSSFKINTLAALTTVFSILLLGIGLWITTSKEKSIVLQEKTRSSVSVSVIILVGPLRGIVMDRLSGFLEIDSGLSLVNRIIVSTATTTFWLCLLSYFINLDARYRQQYRRLISEALVLKSADCMNEELRHTLDNVQKSLKEIKVDNQGITDQSQILRKLSIALKHQVDEIIRPLSRRLWLSAIDKYPKIHVRNTIVDALRNFEYSPLLLSSLISFIALSTMPTFMPWQEAMIRTILIVISIILIRGTFSIFQLHCNWRRSLSIGELLSLSFIPIYVGDVLFSNSHFDFSTPLSLFVYLVIPFIVISIALMNQIGSDRSSLISMMTQSFSEQNGGIFQVQHVASYLHNSLQSEVLALAHRFERAANEPEDGMTRSLLDDLQALINRSVSEDFLNSYGDPRERLHQVIRNWAGIIDITIENAELLFPQKNKAVIAVQIIEELASNLSKHGRENTLNLVCVSNSGRLFIQFDDLHMPTVSSNLGMGSLLLDHLRFAATPEDDFLDQRKLTFLIQ